MNGSIFDRIVTNENSFTELFVTLCRYRVFRTEVVTFLLGSEKGGLSADWEGFSFESDEIETQTQTEGERPDIVIRSAKTSHLLVIEVKTSTATALMASQRDGYRRFFADETQKANNCALVFMVPLGYGHVSEIDTTKPGVHVAYWEDFIGWIEDKELDELNPYIGEFVKVSKSLFGMDVPVIQYSDVPLLYDRNVALFVERVISTVDAAREAARSSGIAVGRLSATEYDYGFYILDDERRVGYFGTAAYHWRDFGQALCVGVRAESVERVIGQVPDLVRGQSEEGLQYFGIPAARWSDSSGPQEILAKLLRLVGSAEDRSLSVRVDLNPVLDKQSSTLAERSIARVIPGLWSLVDTVRLRLQHAALPESVGDRSSVPGQVKADGNWRWFSVRSANGTELLFGWAYNGWWAEYGSPLFFGTKEPARLNTLGSGDKEADPGSEDGWHYRAVRPTKLKSHESEGDIADACVSLILHLIDAGAR